jgi:hypothetical protein
MLNPNVDTNRVVRIATMHDTGLSISPNVNTEQVDIAIHDHTHPHHEQDHLHQDRVLLFFFDMRKLPKHFQLIICAVGAISFYIASGVAQVCFVVSFVNNFKVRNTYLCIMKGLILGSF